MSKEMIIKEQLARVIADWFLEQDDFCHEQENGMVCIDGWYEVEHLAFTIMEQLEEIAYEKAKKRLEKLADELDAI